MIHVSMPTPPATATATITDGEVQSVTITNNAPVPEPDISKRHILFNLASKTRPDAFNAVVDRIYEYCTQPFTILAKLDNDDRKRPLYKTDRVTVVASLNNDKIEAINKGIPRTGWDIIVDVSDDFVFTKPGFDMLIREHCGPNDCVHFPEKHVGDAIIIMAVMGNEYYNRYGFIFNPAYKSLFCDDELTAVAKQTGCYKFVNEHIFYHAHPSLGYGKPDVQRLRTESYWHQDKRTFEKRKAAGFP